MRDFGIVVDAVNFDRPISEPERIAGHGGVERAQENFRRPPDDPASLSQVGEHEASDRFISQQVEAFGWQLELPRECARPRQGVQAFKPLANATAESPGLRLGQRGS